MALTLRNDAKKQIIKILQEDGYPRYARLVGLFDIYLTDDPNIVGYMIPGKAKIVLNQELSTDQVSVIIRHEILHEFLSHQMRSEKFHQSNPQYKLDHQLSNIAADFEISNRGYTDRDKGSVKAIRLGKEILRGLVTEDHHPEWVKLSYEEMYQQLLKQKQENDKLLQELRNKHRQVSHIEPVDGTGGEPVDGTGGEPVDGTGGEPVDGTGGEPVDGTGGEPVDGTGGEPVDGTGGEPVDGTGGGGSGRERSSGTQSDVAARVAQIRRELDDPNSFNEIEQEIASQKRKDTIRNANKAANLERARAGNGGLANFKLDLRRFVDRECGEVEDRTYRRFNPSYEGSGFIVRTRTRYYDDNSIPVINVYWDVSGSFDDPAKTAGARAAINSIQSYEKRGLLKINVFYFSTRVSDKPLTDGGTDGNCIIQHVQETKPDNVIVISDSDINNASITATVPGAVWCLFYDSNAPRFIKQLRGRRENRWYMIEYQ